MRIGNFEDQMKKMQMDIEELKKKNEELCKHVAKLDHYCTMEVEGVKAEILALRTSNDELYKQNAKLDQDCMMEVMGVKAEMHALRTSLGKQFSLRDVLA